MRELREFFWTKKSFLLSRVKLRELRDFFNQIFQKKCLLSQNAGVAGVFLDKKIFSTVKSQNEGAAGVFFGRNLKKISFYRQESK